jgi:hypothetical protein
MQDTLTEAAMELDMITGTKRSNAEANEVSQTAGKQAFVSINFHQGFLSSPYMPEELRARFQYYPEGQRNQVICDFMDHFAGMLADRSKFDEISKRPWREQFEEVVAALAKQIVSRSNLDMAVAIDKVLSRMGSYSLPIKAEPALS